MIEYKVNIDENKEIWTVDGITHREGGPAVVYADGTEEWYLNGSLHRKGEPAVIRANGSKEWWENGKRHRKNGPAVINYDGTKEWHDKLCGKTQSFNTLAVLYIVRKLCVGNKLQTLKNEKEISYWEKRQVNKL